ncbi:MAG: elongation factor P maturation arginine rhamnosyltransferase EarP [Fibrobacter sp.]|jgi:uncharacterized repeat protein (TIGR03837 family)|nr:elongation factor P maturation arginine rhamnosyltransferase EarP [Fibrobacter sp.]
MKFSSVDIFCNVIDNFGDAGVVYRFAREFKIAFSECRVRVFLDNLTVLNSIEPRIDPCKTLQECDSVLFFSLSEIDSESIGTLGVAEVVIEAFACRIPEPFMKAALYQSKLIINLEYLSAEDWVAGYHLKESLLPEGNARKFFFMPGFTPETGGIILNSRLGIQKEELIKNRIPFLEKLLCSYNLTPCNIEGRLLGSVFTYERGFDTFIKELQETGKETTLFIFGDKSRSGMDATLKRMGIKGFNKNTCTCENIHLILIPMIEQHLYDSLLCCTDFNLVRGEDSLARAVCAGKPFIWNAYLQDNRYQNVKVEALLKVLSGFFEDHEVLNSYSDLMLQFNDAERECPLQVTSERYHAFFRDLNKIEHAMRKMSYFVDRYCDLIKNFGEFLHKFRA